MDWKPAGRPMRIVRESMSPSKRICLKRKRYSMLSAESDMTTITALMAWASMLAMATPAMPILNTSTNTRSSTTFERHATIRKYSGRFESPIARRMAEPTLYTMLGTMPMNIILRYSAEPAMVSSGVSISRSMNSVPTRPSTIMNAPPTKANSIAV